MSALAAEDLAIEFGGIKAVDGVSFKVKTAEIFAIIGPNGAGKTTLFNLLSGLYAPRRGRVTLDGADVTGQPAHRLAAHGLSRTFQNLQIFFRMSAVENVMVGRHLHEQRATCSRICWRCPRLHGRIARPEPRPKNCSNASGFPTWPIDLPGPCLTAR